MDTYTGKIVEFPDGESPDKARYRDLSLGHIETIAGWPCKLTAVNPATQELTFQPLTTDEKDAMNGLPKNFRAKINKLKKM